MTPTVFLIEQISYYSSHLTFFQNSQKSPLQGEVPWQYLLFKENQQLL